MALRVIKDKSRAEVLPGLVQGCVVVIGVLDGVHLGHQKLISAAGCVADGLPVVALTFDPHPSVVLGLQEIPILTDLIEREEQLKQSGADEMVVLEFTKDRSNQSPAEFISQVLVTQLNAKHVIVGENFTFGHRAQGNLATLIAAEEFQTHPQSLQTDSSGPITSSRVRKALARGDMSATTRLLGRDYRVCGEVVHGQHLGRDLGYPTANVKVLPQRGLPVDGVYAGWVSLAGESSRSPAAISLGQNSTFGSTERTLEAYVIGPHDLDLYGEQICVDFVQILRPMKTFDSAEDLVRQMREDVASAQDLLGASD